MGKRRTGRPTLAVIAAIGVAAFASGTAEATVPASLSAPGNCTLSTDGPLDFARCDDGVPPTGGTTPNIGGVSAITVPAKYGGDGFTGLPAKAPDAVTVPGSDPAGNIALDVNVSLPLSPPPAGGYPLVVFMHGCCGGSKTDWEATDFTAPGERWHYSNAWFASRGYAVLSYTSRGFVNGDEQGSTGETQLDSREYEINDFQHLACQAMAAAPAFGAVTGQPVAIDPAKVVATGGSYGGGFTWLALTDPKWTCNAETGAAGTPMALAAAAPKYGWTDLVEALVPTGHHSSLPDDLPDTTGCDSGPRQLDGSVCPGGGTPIGTPKTSILTGLYASGKTGVPPGTGRHATFPAAVDQAIACLQGTYPPAPILCDAVIDNTLPDFLRNRSAYYQNDWFSNIASDPSYRVPLFSAATFTDPLFPPVEHRRMINRILSVVPGYPVQSYHGDYQHFVQNKAKEWADLCGADRHRCSAEDYPNGGAAPADFNADPANLANRGVTTRLNRFVDHFAKPTANPSEAEPTSEVTASLQVCPENAESLGVAPDEPGPTFTAPTFEALAPNTLTVDVEAEQSTTNRVVGNTHALAADPVGNSLSNGARCPAADDPAPPGVAVYTSDELPSTFTMIGAARATVDFSTTAPPIDNGFQLNSRLYDVFPDGHAVMVDRGTRRVAATSGTETLELRGNGWRFEPGHRIRIEIVQDDEPHVKASTVPSSANLTRLHMEIPVREGSTAIGGIPGVQGRCANVQRGTKGRDRLRGTEAGDELRGMRGRDRVNGRGGGDCALGGPGADRVRGGRGADSLNAGAGRDRLTGGRGRDRIVSRDGRGDRVRCGPGKDVAKVDHRDRVRGCEKVRRPKR